MQILHSRPTDNTGSKTRNVCFTAFVASIDGYNGYAESLLEDADTWCKRMVVQCETCPETKRLHVQGYAEAKTSRTFGWWKAKLGNQSHIESRHGSAHQAWAYCQKEESRTPHTESYTYGQPPKDHQGKRTDLDRAIETIRGSGSLRDAIFQEPKVFLKHGRWFKELWWMYKQCELEEMEYSPLDVRLYWGDSGTGKTRRAHWEAKEEGLSLFRKPDIGNWCDGYTGQSALLLDDFYGQVGFGLMLKLLDGYPGEPLPVKGSHVYAAFRVVFITSNCSPDQWWPNLRNEGKITSEMDAAVLRRITTRVHFTAGRPWLPPAGPTEPVDPPSSTPSTSANPHLEMVRRELAKSRSRKGKEPANEPDSGYIHVGSSESD